MSQRLVCPGCALRPKNFRGEILAASEIGEPAEWARVVHGVARQATWVCDQCGQRIVTGQRAACETVWLAGQPEPAAWEVEYLAGLMVAA